MAHGHLNRSRGLRHSTTLRLLALLVMSISLTHPVRADLEQRCEEIGTNCVCSEPLDNPDPLYTESHNPSDSRSRECENLWATKRGGAGVPQKRMPEASTVSHVQAFEGPGIRYVNGRSSQQTPSTRRVCFRVYMRFSHDSVDGTNSGYSLTAPHKRACAPGKPGYGDFDGNGNPDCCARNKLMRLSAKGFGLQVSDSGAGTHTTWSVRDVSAKRCKQDLTRICESNAECPGRGNGCANYDKLMKISGPADFSIQNCQTSWCRYEACFSGDFLGGGSEMPLSSELKIVSLERPDDPLHRASPGAVRGFPGGGFEQVQIADMFRQPTWSLDQPPGPGGECNGTRFVSHAMMAQWDTNRHQWIGCAREVEGPDCQPPLPSGGTTPKRD